MSTATATEQPALAHPVLRVVACGSVDDGKSTLIGRLLAETESVPEDLLDYARATRRGGSTVPAGQVDFSLLTDGLEAEHAQGITIDVAYRHLYLPSGRRVIIADAPGHEQYTRNMAVAASTADAAILLVDATRGIRPQTHRHLTVCALMGVRTVIVAVNKLDAVGYHQPTFDKIAAGVRAAAARFDIAQVQVIPVSALAGDNVVTASTATPWYDGPTVLGALCDWTPPTATADSTTGVRLPVQYVVRADGVRGYAGTLAAGHVRVGDRLTVAGGAATATVERLLAAGVEAAEAGPDQPVTLTLDADLDVTRGDLLVDPADADDPVRPATAFQAELVWTGEQPLMHGRSYLLLAGPRTVPAVVTAVRGRRDVVTGEQLAARVLHANDIGTVELTTDTPVPLDAYRRCRDSGGFLLVDRLSYDTVAAGMVLHPLRRGQNVSRHDFTVDQAARAGLKAQRPKVVWLTGLPGAGKSTLADALERRLHALGVHTYLLDGDNLRTGLNKDLGFTAEDRAENVRRVAEVAKLMVDAGLVVIVALVSPFRADRRAARALFDDGEFIEVWVDTPVETCAERDTKGLYAKARAGTIPNMTGVSQPYEPPEAAEIVIDGAASVVERASELVTLIIE